VVGAVVNVPFGGAMASAPGSTQSISTVGRRGGSRSGVVVHAAASSGGIGVGEEERHCCASIRVIIGDARWSLAESCRMMRGGSGGCDWFFRVS